MSYKYDRDFKALVELRDSIQMDIDKHEEHNVLSYAVEEIKYLQNNEDYLEDITHNLEEALIDTDKIIDTLEEYYGWTIKQLRSRAEVRDLKTSGTKAEIVRRLFEDNRRRGELS